MLKQNKHKSQKPIVKYPKIVKSSNELSTQLVMEIESIDEADLNVIDDYDHSFSHIFECADGHLVTWVFAKEQKYLIRQFLFNTRVRRVNEYQLKIDAKFTIKSMVGFVLDNSFHILIGAASGVLIEIGPEECKTYQSTGSIVQICHMIDHFHLILNDNYSVLLYDPEFNRGLVTFSQMMSYPVPVLKMRCFFRDVVVAGKEGNLQIFEIDEKVIRQLDNANPQILIVESAVNISVTTQLLVDFELLGQIILTLTEVLSFVIVDKQKAQYIVIKTIDLKGSAIHLFDNQIFISKSKQIIKVNTKSNSYEQVILLETNKFAFKGVLTYLVDNHIIIQ